MKKLLTTLVASSFIATGAMAFGASKASAQMSAADCSLNDFDPAASLCYGADEGNPSDTGFATGINDMFETVDLTDGVVDFAELGDGSLDWVFDTKIDVGGGENTFTYTEGADAVVGADGFSIAIDSGDGGGVGSWKIKADESYTGPFVLLLKAANYYSAYYFEAGQKTQGFWDTVGVALNRQNKAADLSHISLYTVDNPIGPIVPEPGTLLSLGLLGGGLTLIRRRKAN